MQTVCSEAESVTAHTGTSHPTVIVWWLGCGERAVGTAAAVGRGSSGFK